MGLDLFVNLSLGPVQTTFQGRGSGITSTNGGIRVKQRARREGTRSMF
jgi:hypothetical protein